MRKVDEYELVDDCDRRMLVMKVDRLLACGWEPQGGIAITVSGVFVQAMVKKSQESIPNA